MKRVHDEMYETEKGSTLPEIPAGVSAAGNVDVKGEISATAAAAETGQAEEQGAADQAVERSFSKGQGGEGRRKCPYLDTINRNVLDFDFEKVWLF